MMKNIAVVLRGHVRTWAYNAPVVFDFFDSIAENVDYYGFTWDTPQLKQINVFESFKKAGKELKHFEAVTLHKHRFTSWAGPALLATHAAPYIRQEHNINPYDAVFETRFDVLTTKIKGEPLTPIAPNTWYTNSFTNLVDKYGNRNIGMKDHFLVGTVETYSKMADRFVIHSDDTKECHADMLAFAQNNNIIVSNSLPWVQTIMSRPSDIFRTPNAFTWKNIAHMEIVNPDIPNWDEASINERIDMLVRSNIEWSDYVTNNNNIGIGRPGDELSPELLDYKNRLDSGESMMGLSDLVFY